jgi:hypothetical protein
MGVPQVSGAVLRMTQDDADSEVARSRRRDMGLYTLARLHVDQNIQSAREVNNRLCLSTYSTASASKRLTRIRDA